MDEFTFGKIKAVIFDFDGTLAVLNIDFNAMREEVLELIRGFGVEERSITQRYLLEMIDQVYPIVRKKSPARASEFYRRAHQILQRFELEAARRGRLIPGVKRTLRSLRQRGMKVGIITRNCEEAVRKVFPAVDRFCDVFISRDGVRRVKPHPDHLSSAMKALDVSGEEAVMVGDHPIDIQAGKKVGMKTIGVLTGRTKREEFEGAGADYVLREASEIFELLEQPRQWDDENIGDVEI
ncbi:MAG: HAD family hydrolase [Syntrophaceae bacterium]|nr:HAD family hydrolase [Syntrophaceae bacterium]